MSMNKQLRRLALALVIGAAGSSAYAGHLRYIPIDNDANSDIGLHKTYTHKLDFGNNTTFPVANINGVAFTGAGTGAFPGAGPGSVNIPTLHPGDGTHNVAGNVANLFSDFLYNNNTPTISVSGLTVGQTYDLRLYIRSWGNTSFNRSQRVLFDTDGIAGPEDAIVFNPDDSTWNAPRFGLLNRSYAMSYVYTADAPTATISMTNIGGGTFHLYGLSNELTGRAPINSLYSTGINNSGAQIAPGMPDPHYTLTFSPLTGSPQAAQVITNHPAWMANNAGSQFIGYAEPGTASVPNGLYGYKTQFDLTGFNAASAEITATMFIDNSVRDILINGVSTGKTASGFNQQTGATLKLNSNFVPGINTIEFITENEVSPGPHGFNANVTGSALTAASGNAYGTVSSDNHFAIYAGDVNGQNLRLIGRDTVTDWQSAESFAFTPLPHEYLYVVAWDNPGAIGDPQMVIGQFNLPDGTTIYTNAADWEYVYGSGPNPGDNLDPGLLPAIFDLELDILLGSFAPVGASAPNNTAPWGTNPGIVGAFGGTNAQFIWSDTFNNVSESNNRETYVIFRATRELVVPEPTTGLLALLGLGGVALRRRGR